MVFGELFVNFTYLEQWIGILPFRSGGQWENYKVSYKMPPKVEARLPSLAMTVSTEASPHTTSHSPFDLRLVHEGFLTFKPDRPMRLEEYFKILVQVQRFLTLLIDEPVYFKRVEANGEDPLRPVTIYGTESGRIRQEHPLAPRILFTLPSIRRNFGRVLETWLKNADKLATEYELFFLTFFEPRLRPRFTFLTVMQVIESLHRTAYGGQFVPEGEYKSVEEAMLAAIPPGIPAGLAESLAGAIQFANGLTLKERMRDTLRRLSKRTRVAVTRDEDTFVRRFGNTRNFLTHHGKRSASVFSDSQLRPAAEKMRVLLRTLFLKQAGVSEARILKAIQRNHVLAGQLSWDE